MISGVPNAKNKRLRARVFERDQNRCRYCGVLTVTQEGSPYARTIDHYIPRVLGGPNTIDNCVCCCYSCNMQKSEDDPREPGTLWELIPIPELPSDKMLRLSQTETSVLVRWASVNKKLASIKTIIDAGSKTSYLRVCEENYLALAELARIRRRVCPCVKPTKTEQTVEEELEVVAGARKGYLP